MKPQATRINPHREERWEIIGYAFFLVLLFGIFFVFHQITWTVFL